MAKAHIEWERGDPWTLEQYEEYQKYLEIAGEQDWNWKEYPERLKELNLRFGFPGPHGEML